MNTTDLTGEWGDNEYILSKGDTRISVTLPKDSYTSKLNRRNRFLIDDWDSPSILAYELTKPIKIGNTYGDGGIVAFVMQECNTEDSDNIELHIANYYDYFPREGHDAESAEDNQPENDTGKKVWF